MPGARPHPLRDPILSFLLTFLPNSTCIKGPRPQRVHAPLREILDSPLCGINIPHLTPLTPDSHLRGSVRREIFLNVNHVQFNIKSRIGKKKRQRHHTPPPPRIGNFFWNIDFSEDKFEMANVPPPPGIRKIIFYLKLDLSWLMYHPEKIGKNLQKMILYWIIFNF